jgi:hypothetical protein
MILRLGTESHWRRKHPNYGMAELPVVQPTKFETHHQFTNRQGPGPRRATDAARPRRRGDRMMRRRVCVLAH